MNVTDTTASATSNVAAQENAARSAGGNDSAGALADHDAFLKLLVAQLKNQDPLNPADGMEFLSQLAQFSELEQLMGIRNEIEALRNDAAAETASTETAAA